MSDAPIGPAAIPGLDGKRRCAWSQAAPGFLHYHDNEWGFPVKEDHRLFEKLCLEAFQSGLSWRTILDKREAFRKAFLGFDFDKIASFGSKDVERLLKDAGIVRHRGKIEAVINNAKRAQELVKQEGSLAVFIWRYEAARPARHEGHVLSTSPASITLARDLKRMGWKFVGPTTVYAFMQAMGLVNDHVEGCVIRGPAEAARDGFDPPAR